MDRRIALGYDGAGPDGSVTVAVVERLPDGTLVATVDSHVAVDGAVVDDWAKSLVERSGGGA